MSEAAEQTAVVEYCELKSIPVFHIPNGGKRSKSEAARFKAQGVRPGVPDLMIPIAKGGYHGLFIEMKAGRGKPTPKQVEWIELLRDQGYCAYACAGADNAIALIDRYMSL